MYFINSLKQRNFHFLKLMSGLFLFLLFLPNPISAQENLDVLKLRNMNWLKYIDAPNSLYHHLTGEAYDLLEQRLEEKSNLKTLSDWQERQDKIRQTLWEIAGPFPEKTPLNAKITGKVKKDGYMVENVIYESLPGFYVTASLFLPDKIKKSAPAILFCSGHSHGAYRLPSYQMPLLNLVKKGFIVLAIDPIGQGERLQYFNQSTGESLIGSSTKEHSYPSAQVSLIGKSVARYFIWDGIRGIDYLISRKEVDPKRIGVHGLSGGGTQTAYISALDERVAASAPAGYITSYKRLMESIGVQDGEQNLYHGIVRGIDHPDFIEVLAPKPTLIMATRDDFFSIQGARESFKEVKKVYEIYGKPENIEITEDDHGHGYTKKNREAMYAFFQKHLMLPGSSAEEDVEFVPAQELQKTSTGQLSTSLGGETVFSLNLKESEKFIQKLNESRKDLSSHLPQVIKSAKKLSGYIEPVTFTEPVNTGRIQRESYYIEKCFIKGEGDYVIPYLLFIPENKNNKAVLYLHHGGKSIEASAGREIERFVKNGFVVLAPDLLGIGEMGPGVFKGDAFIGNTSYNIWYTAMLIGRSIVGVQAADVSRLTQVLMQHTEINEVFGVALKEMSPVMLHAAAFNPAITRVALIEPYTSYGSIVSNRYYNSGFVHSIVPGALTAYDLPDLAASLAPRKLLIAGISDAIGSVVEPETAASDLNLIREAYRLKSAGNHLNIIPGEKKEELFDTFIR